MVSFLRESKSALLLECKPPNKKKYAVFESKSIVQLLWQLEFKRKHTVLRDICLIPKQILHPSCPQRNNFKSLLQDAKSDFQLRSLAELPLVQSKGSSLYFILKSWCIWGRSILTCVSYLLSAECIHGKSSWGTSVVISARVWPLVDRYSRVTFSTYV